MSYQDPYYAPQHQRPYNTQQSQQPQQPYADPDFDPYNSRQQQHPTYDQSGYHDDDAYANRNANTSPNGGYGEGDGLGHSREKSRYEDTFPAGFKPPKSTGALRIWRKDHRGPMWAKGGGGRIFLRFFCCSFLIFFFLLLSILLTLGMYIRPPNININQVGLNSTGGSAAQVTASSLNLNFAVNISVENPNYFDVTFKRIRADLTYPLNDMNIGGGEKDDITFKSNTQTSFNFPFALTYTLGSDSSQVVLRDLLSKCGIMGTKQDITVDYKITLGLRILVFTVSPAFSNSFSFECPTSEIESFLQGSGIDINSISGALSGSG